MQASTARQRLLSPRTVLRRFNIADLPALIRLWNDAFCERRNYSPLTENLFRERVLASPAFDPDGLILAWKEAAGSDPSLVGFVHAFKPPPRIGHYRRWPSQHHIALLYTAPAHRRQGIGGRLLQAAQNWLYYCPIHVCSDAMPCYGTIEGPIPPFFGSTDRLAIDAAGTEGERDLVHFLARRGYAVDDAGDVSMSLDLDRQRIAQVQRSKVDAWGLQVLAIDNEHPFEGREPTGRQEYALWGDNRGQPYAGLGYVDGKGLLRGHISWYPMMDSGNDAAAAKVALSRFWLSPSLREHGLGSHLLDLGLEAMSQNAPVRIELHTHLRHNERAAALYESRGFQIDRAWVKLVKT